MSSTLITNISQLVTNSDVGTIKDAALIFEGERIVWVGNRNDAGSTDAMIDADGCAVIPGFVDSHTHSIFAGNRLNDFLARMDGKKYATGGIATTVAATRAATVDQLRAMLSDRMNEFRRHGITTTEIKSGYGLDVATETRMLKLAKEFTSETTFLGAHVIPSEYSANRAQYVELIKGEMLESVRPYAKWIDVFCDHGAFTPDEAEEILKAGIAVGLQGRIHGNQLGDTGGIELAVKFNLASVDHVTHANDKQLALLAESNVVATLLPGAEFSTRSSYPDARRFFQAGVNVAIATDCNPGSSYISSMPFIIALAVRDMYFSPEQALTAATLGGAQALRRDDIGHLSVGAQADIVVLNAPSHEYLAYRPGGNLIKKVLIRGL